MDLNGKTPLVTGSGSGIGLPFAEKLSREGCSIVIADLDVRPKAEDEVKKYSGALTRAVYVRTNVTDQAQLQAAFDKAIEIFGSLDVVCPVAGIFEPEFRPLLSHPN